MKQYKDLIIHGVQVVRHLKGEDVNNGQVALAKLPLAAARSAVRALTSRKAEMDPFAFFGPSDEEGESGGDLLPGADESLAAIMESVEECGIDMQGMATKAMGAFLLYGGDLSSMDPTDPSSMPGIDQISPILAALKDDDEVECSADEMDQLKKTSEEFLHCTGMADFLDMDELESGTIPDFINDIAESCSALSGFALGGPLGEDDLGDMEEQLLPCMQSVLGDNPMGDFIRYQYNNLDKTFECTSKFGEELPHCLLSAPIQEEGDKEETLTFPLSLEKKMTCVLGSSYESIIEQACVAMYEELDSCLPHDLSSGTATPASCGEEEAFDGMIDISVVTGNQLPAFCDKVYTKNEDVDAEQLKARFDYYNDHRVHTGWSFDEAASESKNEEVEVISEPEATEQPEEKSAATEPQAVAASVSRMSEPEQPEDEYVSNPIDVASAEESVGWEDGEAEEDDTTSTKHFFPFVLAGLAVVAAVVVALIVKRRGLGTNPQRPVSTKEYSDLTFKEVDHEMA